MLAENPAFGDRVPENRVASRTAMDSECLGLREERRAKFCDERYSPMEITRSLLIFLALCSPALAQNKASDIVQDDLIDAPDTVTPLRSIFIKLPSHVPFTIEPEPDNRFSFIDEESGKRVYIIQEAVPPGYTVTINHAVIHPTEDELAGAPTVPDPKDLNQVKAFKDYLRKHSKDEIYRDSHFIKVGSPPPPDPPPGDDLTETEKKIRDWAGDIGNKSEVRQVADNYGRIVSSIEDGDYDKLSFRDASEKILGDILAANQKVAKDPAWETTMKENLRVLLNEAQADGDLDSLKKIGVFFKQIQTGLEASL